MDGRFNNSFVTQKEESGNMPESGAHSQFSGVYSDGKITSTTPKRSRRCVQKRMISLPIGEVEGSRVKGEGTPPFDSWTWRKYGQKPIKGSPYPRGYYRCSSSKGCPARKQVERSRVDPTMLVVTYSYEHNHPWPASRNSTTTAAAAVPKVPEEESAVVFAKQPEIEQDDKFADLGEDTLITAGDFSWFPDVGSSSPTLLDSPICGGNGVDGDVGMIFPMREEDESLFADLGELPEFSLVFRRGVLERDEERRGCSLRAATWCGSTG